MEIGKTKVACRKQERAMVEIYEGQPEKLLPTGRIVHAFAMTSIQSNKWVSLQNVQADWYVTAMEC